MTARNKMDSNVVGLRYAWEETLKTLPGSPIWYGLDPNSYEDFGSEVTTMARSPISGDRQRKKGVVTDLDNSGGLNIDLTQTNIQDLLQGFFFADLRRKVEFGGGTITGVNTTVATGTLTFAGNASNTNTVTIGAKTYTFLTVLVNSANNVLIGATASDSIDNLIAAINASAGAGTTYGTGTTANASVTAAAGAGDTMVVTARTSGYAGLSVATTETLGSGSWGAATLTGGSDVFTAADDLDNFAVGDLIKTSGFDDDGNNGFFRVVSASATTLGVASLVVDDGSPAAGASIVRVGVQTGTGDIDVDVTGSLPALTSTVLDFTTLALVTGEWIFIGGDAAAEGFTNSENNGFKRVRSIAANRLELDKSEETMVSEANTTKTVQIFFGRVLKNETGASIVRRSCQIERTLGAPDDAAPSDVQAEYLVGAVANEMKLGIKEADKVMADLTFVACDHETRDAATGVKSGDRPTLTEQDAFNTSAHFSRIKLSTCSSSDESPTPLAAFLTEMEITLKNNISPNKAIGTLGAFDLTAGNFDVEGSVGAYFTDVAAIAAVRNCADVTLDFVMAKQNSGIIIDLPLITLSKARLEIEKDEPIMMPLDMQAASGEKVYSGLDHTMLIDFFDYLPDAAMPA
jgi:hypothetical protein